MTSKKSSPNKAVAKNDLKTAFALMTVPSIFSFLAAMYYFVFLVYRAFSQYIMQNDMGESIEAIRKNIQILLACPESNIMYLAGTSGYLLMGIIAIIIGVLFAFSAFATFQSKTAVNVYLSLGIKRSVYFKNRVIASIVSMAATSLVPIIIDVIMNIYFLGDAGYILYHAIFVFLEYFTFMLIGFSMVSIAMSVCNTVIEAVFFGGGIIWFPMIVVASFDAFATAFLRGYDSHAFYSANEGGRSLINITSIINPIMFAKPLGDYSNYVNVFSFVNRARDKASVAESYYNGFGNYGREIIPFEYVLPVIVWLIVCTLFLLLAKRIFINKKAENAGLFGIGKFDNIFFACEVGLLASVSVLSFAMTTDSNIASRPFIVLFISVLMFALCYFIIVGISKRTIKLGKKQLVPAIASIGVIVITSVILYCGGFGYTSRVPDITDIESATIDAAVLNQAGESDKTYITPYITDVIFSADNISEVVEINGKEDLQAFTQLHKKLLKRTDNMNSGEVEITYTLKNGSLISRTFKTVDNDAYFEILSLTDTSSFENYLEFMLSSDKKDDFENLPEGFNIEDKQVVTDCQAMLVTTDGLIYKEIENTDALRDAILADRLALTYDQIYACNEKPLGAVTFLDYDYYSFFKDYSGNALTDATATVDMSAGDYAGYGLEGLGEKITFHIYPSTVNTVNYLKSTGEYSLLTEESAFEKYDIVSARVMKCSEIRKEIARQYYWSENDVNMIFEAVGNNICVNGAVLELEQDETYNTNTLMHFELFKNAEAITDLAQVKELYDASRTFGYASGDDYVVFFQNENESVGFTALVKADDMAGLVK